MTEPKRRARWLRRIEASAQNAVELARLGRLSPKQGAPYEVVERDRTHKLRRYLPAGGAPATGSAPLLLVPPLMLTAEIYDVAPDLSAVVQLGQAGVDAWVVDFGAPEEEEGGMERTLDDHVRAVAASVRTVARLTGQKVHLAGYSQGGMFCYQAAAFLRSEDLASVITFGSPVDIHRNLPGVSDDVAAQLIRAARVAIALPLQRVEGLPGFLTSTGFKLLSVRKELSQVVDFVAKLHDRDALEKRESRRRFLAGEGFVAWPGPALRKFVDEFIVHNRLASGGFVIDGRTVTLADIRVPIVAFVGLRDEIARPASIRAVKDAAPEAEVSTIPLAAGHFGLVVGSTASAVTWPNVIQWVRWRDGKGPRPPLLDDPTERAALLGAREVEDAAFDDPLDIELFYDTAVDALGALWKKVGDTTRDMGDIADDLRWQVPRLRQLEGLSEDTRISFSGTLAKQARRHADATFFLWKGRAFTYADADRRVTAVARGFVHTGVEPGQRVGVVMRARPSALTAIAALNRLGAQAVVISPGLDDEALRAALRVVPLDALVTDPEDAARLRTCFHRDVLVLGGGGRPRELGAGIVDMERIDPEAVTLPPWFRADPGQARDVAIVFVSAAPGGPPRAARITNGRWAFSALGAAAACTLTPQDTVYCCLPLHHPAGLLVAVGSALVGGCRLALAPRFDPAQFWPEVRRYGVTVAFYAGTMCRTLVNSVPHGSDTVHPLRLFAGSGVRTDVWHRLGERFGRVGVLEFYASTECNVVLANASGAKVGAVGRRLPGSAEVALVKVDFAQRAPLRDAAGHLVRAGSDEPGLLISRLDASHPAPPSAIGPDGRKVAPRTVEGAFEAGDRWILSGDLLRRDADGDYWLVDRLDEVVLTRGGWVSPRHVEDTLYQVPGVGLAVVTSMTDPAGGEAALAVVVPRPGVPLDDAALGERLVQRLDPHARPRVVRFVAEVAMNDGHRPLKGPLREAGPRAPGVRPPLVYDAARERYAPG